MDTRPIYLDYAATSPVDPTVVDAMTACLAPDGTFANAASPHDAGRAARAIIDQASRSIGSLVNAPADRLVFTSGATEANNIALKGVLSGSERPHLITTVLEHRSVLDVADYLENEGVAVTRLPCDPNGIVAPSAVAEAIRPETALVSMMQVNNEIGSVQDIESVATICRNAGVPLHVDAAQAAGKVPLDIAGWNIDLVSLTAHKTNGPKGIGALYVREGLRLKPFLHGGAAMLGIRAGTLPTHQIAGFGKAFELASDPDEVERLTALKEQLWSGLAEIPGIIRNGDPARSAPHILSVSLPGIEGESLRLALAGIAVSSGSACTSDSPEPSHVLRSLGHSDALAESSLRFGVGRFTTAEEIDLAARRVRQAAGHLLEVASGAPDWCST